MMLVVLHDAWRLHPLAWIHRSEARRIAWELRRSGHAVRRSVFDRPAIADLGAGRYILRLSDPVMFEAVEALSSARVPYIGPGFEAMKRCYDKYTASRLLAANGFICPETELGTEADRIDFPVVLKPRWGSDSISLRHYAHGPVPTCRRNERYIVQRYIRGADITIGVLNGQVGAPFTSVFRTVRCIPLRASTCCGRASCQWRNSGSLHGCVSRRCGSPQHSVSTGRRELISFTNPAPTCCTSWNATWRRFSVGGQRLTRA